MNSENVKIEPLRDVKLTDIKTYGDLNDCLVVETVATYYNFYNFQNTPKTKTREYKEKFINSDYEEDTREIIEKIPINYNFNEDPIINLIYSQIVKIIINGTERLDKTKKDMADFLTRKPEVLNEILKDIVNNSSVFKQNEDNKDLKKKK